MRFCHSFLFILLGLCLLPHSAQGTLLRAFPEAEGFGATTPGGRGGSIHFVTTLEDYVPGKETPVPGSLRAAIDAKGPRYILFRVSGTITLKADLYLRHPFVTIAGQSAPGDGIALKDHMFVIATHDVIVRHLRMRSGDAPQEEQLTVGIFGGNNIILDHCSMTWAVDEVLSTFGASNITVQWSIIAEGLSRSFHPKGEHSKGSILDGKGGFSLHHNIYAHNAARNARVNNIVLDFRNNIVYNWGYRGGYTTEGPGFINYINNYFKAGPSTRKSVRTYVFEPGDDAPRIFLEGNVLEGQAEETANNRLLLKPLRGFDAETIRNIVTVDRPFPAMAIAMDPVDVARTRVLDNAGATLPKRDAADARLMEEIRTGTGRIIDSPKDVGGWPELTNADPPADTDGDGMPDAWELEHDLDTVAMEDYLTDPDGDGYPNLEEYLNGTNPRQTEDNVSLDKATVLAQQDEALQRTSDGKKAYDARMKAEAEAAKAARDARLAAMDVRIETQDGNARVWLGDTIHLDLAPIPAGTFLMGSPESEDGEPEEHPQQPVTISKPFFMGTTLITNQQYVTLMGRTERRTRKGQEDFPAHEVTWFEGVEFCELLSQKTGRTFRLPTEAEWEYACRAGTTTAFYTGDTISTDQANFDGKEATRFNPAGDYIGKNVAVAQYPPNPWGLYDMHGNQAQYCLDNVGRRYSTEPVTDPTGPPGNGAKVLRGGQSKSKAAFIRSAARYGYAPGVGFGLRIVMETEK